MIGFRRDSRTSVVDIVVDNVETYLVDYEEALVVDLVQDMVDPTMKTRPVTPQIRVELSKMRREPVNTEL